MYRPHIHNLCSDADNCLTKRKGARRPSGEYDRYQTYPREIVAGLRVGMTRSTIDDLLGPPEPPDVWDNPDERQWLTYRPARLPDPVAVIEVWYGTRG
jgi:hypothetical protein